MLDLTAGFVHSQCLLAVVDLNILPMLMDAPQTRAALSARTRVPEARLEVLLNAAVALELITRQGDAFHPTRRGAALTGVPGLADMIRHHAVLYRDLADPVAFFRGETKTELADFWPYVFGAGAASDPDTAARYSRLMADSQTLVAEETLAAVSLKDVTCLMDVGGGTGAFLSHALAATPGLTGVLFDLPAVVSSAPDTFAAKGQTDRVTIRAGSFRDESLPEMADAISLVRVLYDHSDETIAALLARVFAALPSGGRLIISEPMTGGDTPTKAGDAYFAVYTLAMGTGRTRSAEQISQAMLRAGFTNVTPHATARPFLTSVLSAEKP